MLRKILLVVFLVPTNLLIGIIVCRGSAGAGEGLSHRVAVAIRFYAKPTRG
jgi:hypothetical protein